MAMVLTFISHT